MVRIIEWKDPPQMDTGAPMPFIRIGETELFVAYIVSDRAAHEVSKEYAVVQFTDVPQHIFGYPNDEALGEHPLYRHGLAFYAFNEVVGSPYVAALGKRNAQRFPGSVALFSELRHWIVTFHDETLEVIAKSAKFLGRTHAGSGAMAISSFCT